MNRPRSLPAPRRPGRTSLAVALALLPWTGCLEPKSAPPGEPTAEVSPATLAFGDQLVGHATPALAVTLGNTGNAPLAIASIAVTGDYARTTDCESTLAAGATCGIDVTFTPQAAGHRAGTLTIVDDAAGSPHEVALSGTGVAMAPVAELSPASLAFGSGPVGLTTAAQRVTLGNTGNAPLAIASIAVTGDYARTTDCESTLAAGATCAIDVTFTPQEAGARAGTLTITDDAARSPHGVALSGTGVATAPPPVGPTLVQHLASTSQPLGQGEAGNHYRFTLPNPVLAGNCLVLGVAHVAGSTFAATPITDDAGNVWPVTPSAAIADGAGDMDLAIFVLPDARPGVTTLTVHFTAPIQPFAYTVSEFAGVASASPVSGSSGARTTAPDLDAGTFTPADNDATGGNLVWSFFWSDETFGHEVTRFAAAGPFALLDANIFWHAGASAHSASAWWVQPAAAPVTPGLRATMASPSRFVGLAVALRAAPAGTLPAPGIRIVKVLHFTSEIPPNVLTLQAPTTGNLLVLASSQNSSEIDVTGVADDAGATYTRVQPSPDVGQLWIAGSHAPDLDLLVTITSVGQGQPTSWTAYDITGAASAPIGASAGRELTTCDGWTTLVDFPLLVPTQAEGLTIAACELGQGPGLGFAPGAPEGAIWDFVYYEGERDFSTMNNADCRGHVTTHSTAPQHWNWSITSTPANSCHGVAVHLLQ